MRRVMVALSNENQEKLHEIIKLRAEASGYKTVPTLQVIFLDALNLLHKKEQRAKRKKN